MYTGTGTYGIMTTCKYRLPCGYCELKKKICTAENPITITPTWTMPMTTEEEYKESLEAMKNLAKRTNLEMAIKDILKE